MDKVVIILAIAVLVMLYLYYRQGGEIQKYRKKERMKQAFLQNIEHEIQVPLKAMNNLATTVGSPDLYLSKNEKRSISEQILYHTNLVSTLVSEILMFTDVEPAGKPLNIESFSPNSLCRRCLEANTLSIYHQQAVQLVFKRDLSDEFFVHTDRHLVELIINKLIINSCRFTEKGEITVGCNTTENTDCLTIYVQDTGLGIPENRRQNIFTFFDQPENMNDEAELDLSICQKIARKLGGELRHDTNYTGGTRLLLILPLR